jgi:anti-sigma factor RsiW
MHDCQSSHRLMHAYLDHELSAKEALDVQAHLDECAACALLYRNEKLYLELIKESLPAPVAPPSLREKVRNVLAEAGQAQPLRKRLRQATVPSLALAAAVLVLVVGAFFFEKKPVPALVDVAVQSHQEYLTGKLPLDIISHDPIQVTRWLEKRTNFPVALGQEPVKNMQLLGGRLIELQGGRAVFLAYEMGHHRLSLVMTAAEGVDLFGGREFTFKQTRFYQSAYHGFQSLSWTQEGIAYVFVSDQQEVNKLACLICHGDEKQKQVIKGFADQDI